MRRNRSSATAPLLLISLFVGLTWATGPTPSAFAQGGGLILDPADAELDTPYEPQRKLETPPRPQQELEAPSTRQQELEEPSQRQRELERGTQRQREIEH